MSISYEDSIKKYVEEKNVVTKKARVVEPVATMSIDEMMVGNTGSMTLDEDDGIAAYAGDDGNWEQLSGYVYYNSFSDDNISVIDDKKDIKLDGKQFNITQE